MAQGNNALTLAAALEQAQQTDRDYVFGRVCSPVSLKGRIVREAGSSAWTGTYFKIPSAFGAFGNTNLTHIPGEVYQRASLSLSTADITIFEEGYEAQLSMDDVSSYSEKGVSSVEAEMAMPILRQALFNAREVDLNATITATGASSCNVGTSAEANSWASASTDIAQKLLSAVTTVQFGPEGLAPNTIIMDRYTANAVRLNPSVRGMFGDDRTAIAPKELGDILSTWLTGSSPDLGGESGADFKVFVSNAKRNTATEGQSKSTSTIITKGTCWLGYVDRSESAGDQLAGLMRFSAFKHLEALPYEADSYQWLETLMQRWRVRQGRKFAATAQAGYLFTGCVT